MAKGPSCLDSAIDLVKCHGFVFPCGDVYGGTHSVWDYDPPDVELKENIERTWWNATVRRRADVVGLNFSVILLREAWATSGHVKVFTNPLIEYLNCRKRARQDQLTEELAKKKSVEESTLSDGDTAYPNCDMHDQWTEPRIFPGLFKTYLGPIDNETGLHYLRPETTQGISTSYADVMNVAHKKLPFGTGQIDKSFRNEIVSDNLIFRTRELEQMELEFLCKPGTDKEWHQHQVDYREAWYVNPGIDPENLCEYGHLQEKLSHYSRRTVDLEYRFGFQGSKWGELEGTTSRTDHDLTVHSETSDAKLDYPDPNTKECWIPYVIEPSTGLTRSLMAFLIETYHEDETPNIRGGVDKRVVLKLNPRLTPVRAAVLSLSREPELADPAQELTDKLCSVWNVDYDDTGAVGRRYRHQDKAGTPFCITYDLDSIEDRAITTRERDAMEQVRILLDKVKSCLIEHLGY